jgi:hypothetical protein
MIGKGNTPTQQKSVGEYLVLLTRMVDLDTNAVRDDWRQAGWEETSETDSAWPVQQTADWMLREVIALRLAGALIASEDSRFQELPEPARELADKIIVGETVCLPDGREFKLARAELILTETE